MLPRSLKLTKKRSWRWVFTAVMFLDREDDGFGNFLTQLAWEVHGQTERKVPLIAYSQLVKGTERMSSYAKSFCDRFEQTRRDP